jgi:hypothetical protein
MIEVLKQALEALKDVGVLTDREWQAVHKNKANELRQAIAELESQEPVACDCNQGQVCHICDPITPPQRTEPPDWFPAVENILNEYGLQAIDFVADFKEAMKDAEKSQRTWVGLTDEEIEQSYETTGHYQKLRLQDKFAVYALAKAIEAKLKEKNT